MSDAVPDIARILASIESRLAAVERTAQARFSSVEGGVFSVVDDDGNPIFTVGPTEDDTPLAEADPDAEPEPGEPEPYVPEVSYVVSAGPTARIIANDLDLPEGTITETAIADDAISTPKLRANSVTADQIAAGAIQAHHVLADAIDGRVITGATLRTAADGARVVVRPGVAEGEEWRNDGVIEMHSEDSHGAGYISVDGLDGQSKAQSLYLFSPRELGKLRGSVQMISAGGLNGTLATVYALGDFFGVLTGSDKRRAFVVTDTSSYLDSQKIEFITDALHVTSAQTDVWGRVGVHPIEGASSEALGFNHGYGIFADNVGAGTDNTRLWINGPGGGEVVIGPRSGTVALGQIRLRGNVRVDGGDIGGTFASRRVTSGASNATGYTVTALDAEIVGERMCSLSLAFTNTEIIPTSATMNISDRTICTLPAGIRPRQLAQFVFSDGQSFGEGVVNTNGTVTLRSLSYEIAAGRTTRLQCVYTLP